VPVIRVTVCLAGAALRRGEEGIGVRNEQERLNALFGEGTRLNAAQQSRETN
jgi:signal transduction histidine kinase